MSTMTAGTREASRKTPRIFYVIMALALAVTIFAGFAQSYFLKGFFGTPELTPLKHIHGVVFTAWVVLLVTQTTLVAKGRTGIHRKLGMAGAVLIVAMVILGVAVAVESLRANRAPIGDPRSFLVFPLFDIAIFAILAGAGVIYRKRPQTHKRLMMLATITIADAAIARLPGMMDLGPPVFFLLQDLFIVAGVTYDYVTQKRINRAYIWGGLLIVLSQPLRLVISQTPLWLAFADWLKG